MADFFFQNGHSIAARARSQAVTSTPAAASLGSNKRPRQYASVDSDEEEESDDSDLEYDESDVEIDGFVARNVDFYAQLEEQQKVNSEVYYIRMYISMTPYRNNCNNENNWKISE